MKKLTPKQRAFVGGEYVIDLNGAQAAIRAGYSKRTAKEMAHENLTKPHIVAAIQKVVEARSERTEVTQDRVVEELAHLAFASIGDVVEWDGSKVTIKASEDLPDEVLHAISEVGESFNKDGDRSVKVKQYDKPQIPHLDKRKTSLAPATKRAKMFLDQEKRSPTRCSYYEARLTGIPVRAGEGLDGYDGAVRPDDVPGVDASSGFEVIGRAPRETAGERSGLDGQPDDHLADAAELGRRRVGVRP